MITDFGVLSLVAVVQLAAGAEYECRTHRDCRNLTSIVGGATNDCCIDELCHDGCLGFESFSYVTTK